MYLAELGTKASNRALLASEPSTVEELCHMAYQAAYLVTILAKDRPDNETLATAADKANLAWQAIKQEGRAESHS